MTDGVIGGQTVTTEVLSRLYERRFNDEQFRTAMWQVLCSQFFQKWVRPTDTVVEIAAGYCEFSNNIKAGRRIAVDLNEDVKEHAGPDVEVHVASATDLSFLEDGSADLVFMSNFLEHLTREDILLVLAEGRRVLRPGTGRLMVLQPNVRFCAKDYWMFFDHITPIDDRALVEAFDLTGLELESMILRFLPYTTKSRLPNSIAMVKLYLRFPLLWKVLGAQSLLVAKAA